MKKYGLKKRIYTMFLICAMLLVSPMSQLSVFAEKTSDELDDERERTEEERDQNQQALDSTNASIRQLTAEQTDIQEEIDETTEALVQVMAEIEIIEGQIAEKEEEIAEASALLDEAIALEESQYDAMVIRIKYLYESGNEDLLSIYMESGSITEALTRAEYVEDLYEYDRNMLLEYQNTIAQVEQLKTQLEEEQTELAEIMDEHEEEAAYMDDVIDELKALSDNYAAQISSARSRASGYAAQIAAQNQEIQQLAAQADAARAEEQRQREEAQAQAQAQVASAEGGTITTTNDVSYDTTPIYSSGGSDLGKSIASFACQYIGNPYVSGGTSLTNGADCSGFVFAVYKEFGYSVPRTSYALRGYGQEVSYSSAQPGDIICYSGHVGIYIGDGMIVHASTPQSGIKIGSATYREILSVRRII